MEIEKYIASGIAEAYVLRSASGEEIRELLSLKKKHPGVNDAISEFGSPPGTYCRTHGC